MNPSMHHPLAGVRVVDLSTGLAGPYCTKILADAGADVIKIEGLGGTDPLRRRTSSGRVLKDSDDSALFQHLNASKRGVLVDLTKPADTELLFSLAASADILVEDQASRSHFQAAENLARLHERNPALSVLSITPWGTDGPWKDRPATEFTLQAATGVTESRRCPGRKPVAAGGQIGEWMAGAFGAEAALFAWLSACNTGRGHHVDLSIFESMFVSMPFFFDLSSQWMDGPLPGGIEIPSIERTRDGWVGFCTITRQQWEDFCHLIEHPELLEVERYYSGFERSKDLWKLKEIIQEWTQQRSTDEIVELFNALRIPCTYIGNGRDTPALEHFAQRGVYSVGPGGFLRPRPPVLFEKSTLRPPEPAPHPGEHQAEIIDELNRVQIRRHTDNGSDILPMKGLRVVELSTFWAGPIAGSHLSNMGAEVIKVESIQRPDGVRYAAAVGTAKDFWEWSPVFHGVNCGKRGITLKLDDPEGKRLLEELIADADIVIENFSARVLESFGFSWETIHALNPRIIMLRMPSFGLDGPWRDRTGFAQTVEQVSGLSWRTGYEDMPLVVRGVCDPLGGINGVTAILLALEDRKRTGEGQLIEVPLVEGALNIACAQVIEYSAYGELIERNHNRSPDVAPQGVYACAEPDDFIALSVEDDAQWQSLCHLMGSVDHPEIGASASLPQRHQAHDLIDAAVESWLSSLSRDDAVDRLIAAGIPAQAVRNGHDRTPHPQLSHRDFFQRMNHPVTGDTRYPGLPMDFSGLPRQLHSGPPPTLGQHNEEVLGGVLGLSADALEELKKRQVIGMRPAGAK